MSYSIYFLNKMHTEMRDYVIQVFLFLCIFFRFVSLFANF